MKLVGRLFPDAVDRLRGADKELALTHRDARPQDIYFLWPSFLPDPKDDMVLELAVASGATHIVTHNSRHFRSAVSFGIRALAPAAFLRLVGL